MGPASDATHPQRSVSAAAPHQYGTRTRQNSVIRPSSRLRQSPDPPLPQRRIKPLIIPKNNIHSDSASSTTSHEHHMPIFPPSNVMLHHEDATNKTFMAIGRALLSVDNKAVTIKDLSEMAMNYGLVCRNVSAASQAIMTFIRSHKMRCDAEQDQPLLLHHVLSGTPSDDDLLPGLYSISGGAHCELPPDENRLTNFRKGTRVYYLSKAAGVQCPFSRTGIRLCDYGESGKVGYTPTTDKEKKRERDRQRRAANRGVKRKRLPRSCADKGAQSDSGSEAEAEKPPQKVKLTLRLKPDLIRASLSASPSSSSLSSRPASQGPSAPSPRPQHDVIDISDQDSDSDSEMESDSDSDDGSMSVASSPSSPMTAADSQESFPLGAYPAPVRSLSMPPCTVSSDGRCLSFSLPPPPPESPVVASRRSTSPSVHSEASPPPDSDDEVGLMPTPRQYSYTSMDEDVSDEEDMDWDFDDETHWEESPGPASPPASSALDDDDVIVKQEAEPEDWEASEEREKVLQVVARAATGDMTPVKVEELETWHWGYRNTDSPSWLMDDDDVVHVKEEEDVEQDGYLTESSAVADEARRSSSPAFDFHTLTLSSPISPTGPRLYPSARRPSELQWTNVPLAGPDSVTAGEFEDGEWRGGRRHTISTCSPQTRAPPMALLTSFSEGSSWTTEPSAIPSTPSLSSSVATLSEPRSSPFFAWTPSPSSSKGDTAIGPCDFPSSPMRDSAVAENEPSASGSKRSSGSSIRTVRAPADPCHSWEDGARRFDAVEDHILSMLPEFSPEFTIDIRPPATEEILDTPLSPTEQEMFHSLCALPEWEPAGPACKPAEESDAQCEDRLPLRRSKRVANAAAVRERTRPTSKRGARSSK